MCSKASGNRLRCSRIPPRSCETGRSRSAPSSRWSGPSRTSAQGLPLTEHVERRCDASLTRRRLLGFGNPAGVLLAMCEGHRVEGGLRSRITGQGLGKRLRDLDLARRGVELELELDRVTGLRAAALADL